MSTISQKQLFRLSGVARAAWVAKGKPGYVPAQRNATKAFDFWRKVNLSGVTSNNAESWSDVLNRDFETVEAHFAKLSGDAGREFNAEKSKLEQPRTRKLAAISKMLAECGRITGHRKWCLAYAVTISKNEYGGDLSEISDAQLHRILVTISERTRKAIKAHAETQVDAAQVEEFGSEDAVQFADADSFEPLPEPLGV